jgi:tetratricopeptide (TPR) repeat protein
MSVARPRTLLTLIALWPALAPAEPPLTSRAETLLFRAASERDPARRFSLADEAAALCERAIAERPKDPLPHVVLARALSTSDLAHPEACRPGACERAAEELRRARVLDVSGLEAERIASELGIVLSRLGQFAEALVEYDRALRLVANERPTISFEDPSGRASLYGNSGETLMALGRLEEAIARYRFAEAAAAPGELEWQLAEWGLGLAYDRDEQLEKSRAAIERALDYDPTMAHLSDEGVFFEPAGDKRAYQALGHEVAGDRELAIAAWREFLATQPNGRWTRRARAHLEALRRGPARPSEAPVLISFGELRSSPSLRAPAELDATLRAHEGDLALCYQRALRTRPALRGTITLGFEVHPTGWLRGPAMLLPPTPTPSGEPKSFERCIALASLSWRFPPIDGREIETVVVPVELGGRQ